VDDACLIFRTAWVYTLRTSAGSLRQSGFVNKVLDWARQQETLRVVSDQVANPTWARMLAEITAQVLARGKEYIHERVMLAEITAQVLARGEEYIHERAGLYHLAGGGFASRFEWARLILELDPNRHEQMVKELLPAPTSDFPTPARRPLFSALNCDKFAATFGLRLSAWEAALRMAMDVLK